MLPASPQWKPLGALRTYLFSALALCACGEEVPVPEPPPTLARDHPRKAEVDAKLAEGLALQKSAKVTQAMACFEEAVRIAPDLPEARLPLISVLLGNTREADPKRALEELDRAYPRGTSDPAILIQFARAAYRSHDSVRCRALANALLQLQSPTPPIGFVAESRFLLGSVAEREGEFTAALDEFAAAVQLLPEYPIANLHVGLMHRELGRFGDAAKSIERAIELKPDLLAAHFNLAHVYRELGRNEDAERETTVHYWLNRYVDHSGETEDAYLQRFEALEKLEILLPPFTQGRIQLTKFRLSRDMNEAAVASARQLIVEHPELLEVYTLFVEAVRRSYPDQRARAEVADLLKAARGIPAAQRASLEHLVAVGIRRG